MKKIILFISIFIVFAAASAIAQDVNEQNSRTHYKLGLAYYEKNDFKNAIVEFEQALKFDPSNANAYYSLGTVYLSIGNYMEAIKNLELAVQYNPNIADAFYNLGISYYRTRQYNKSVNCFKSAIALNQNDIDYHINLGVVYRILNQYPEAIVEYQKALLINPASIPALLNLGVAYRLNGDVDKAIEQYNKVLKIDENNKEALYNLSLIKRDYDLKQNVEDKPFSIEEKPRVIYTTPQQPLDLNKKNFESAAVAAEPQQVAKEDKFGQAGSVYFSTQENYINLKDEISFTRKIVEEIKSDMIKMKDDYAKTKENLLQRVDELRKSAADEIKKLSKNSEENLKTQQEQYLLSLDEFRKEFDEIKKARKYNDIELKNMELNKEVTGLNLKIMEIEKSKQDMINKLSFASDTELISLKKDIEQLKNISRDMEQLKADYKDLEFFKKGLSDLEQIRNDMRQIKEELKKSQNAGISYNYENNYSISKPAKSSEDNISINELLNNFNLNSQTTIKENLQSQQEENNFGFSPQSAQVSTARSYSYGKVNINSANVQELTTLPSIDAVKAKNIIWYRENIEKFKSSDDIIRVPGITINDLDTIKNSIVTF